MLGIGSVAPRFVLPGIDGTEREIGSGSMLLVFFKITCPTCQLTMPFLQRLADAGVTIVAVAQDPASSTAGFNQAFGVRYPTLVDTKETGYTASNAYEISVVPSLFLIEEGQIVWTGESFVKTELEQLAGRFGVTLFREGERVPALRPG